MSGVQKKKVQKVTNLPLDLVLFIILRHTEEHNLQFPKVQLHGLEEANGDASPEKVAACKVPGAEIYINEPDVALMLVLRRPDGIEKDQSTNKSQKGGLL